MFEVHDQETPNDLDLGEDNDHELCVQLAIKMAACLPDDPERGEMILDMARKFYAVVTDIRHARERALVG